LRVCVHRPDHVYLGGERRKRRNDHAQPIGRIGVLGPVHGGEHERAAAEFSEHRVPRGARARQPREVERRIEHHIADPMDLARGDALALQVGHGRLGRREQPVRHVVGEHAVDFFWHAAVERPQAGLDMRDRDVQFGCRQRAGKRGVGVTVQQHGVRLLGHQHLFDAGQLRARHRAVRAAAHAEVPDGRGNAELAEEHLGHVVVEVLAGVQQALVHARLSRERCAHGRGLDELRTGTDDGDQVHGRCAIMK
jgi:hypothetical protein